MWYKGKEYYSVNKWVGIFNRDYKDKGIKVNAHDIHQLFGYYKIPKLKINGNGEIVENGRRVLYPVNLVNQVRTMKEDFMYILYNITEYGVSNGKEFYIPYNEKEITEPSYKNDENDMKKYSNNLEKQYQFENINRIIKQTINEWGKKNIVYGDNDKIELVKDKNVVNGGNFPIKRNGQIYWVSRSNSISLYVFCKNKEGEWCILSSLRGPNSHVGRGKWNVVCGFLDYGYSLEETAVKECFEETGVKINKNMLKNAGTNSSRKYDDVSTRFYAFLNGITDNYPTSISNCEEGEVSDAKWIPLSDVQNYRWFSNQGNKAKEFAEKMLNNTKSFENDNDFQNFLLSLQNLNKKGIIDNTLYQKIINLINVIV